MGKITRTDRLFVNGIEITSGVTGIPGDITFEQGIDHNIIIDTSEATDANGGFLTIKSGDANGAGDGGDLVIQAGKSGDDGTVAGSVIIRGGEGGANSGTTGAVLIETVNDLTGSNSSSIILRTGTSSATPGEIITQPGGIVVRRDSTTASTTFKQEISRARTTSTGAAAIPVTGRIHRISTTGIADALTLANGIDGQWLTIFYLSESSGANTAILTPATLAGPDTTITFTTVGDSATLYYDTTIGWIVTGSKGVVIA